MRDNGVITKEDHERAVKEKLLFADVSNVLDKAPYFTDFVKAQLLKDIPDEELVGVGYTIYSTLDSYYQRVVEESVDSGVKDLEARLAKPIAPLQLFETENFQYAISAVDSGTATLYLLAPRNETVQLEGYPWPSTMVRQTNQTMTFRHDALDKSLVQTLDGPYVAHVNATHIRLETALQPDQEFGSSLGDGRVTRGTDSTLTLDLNHPLAGKDLTFEIRVDAIERRE